MARPWAAARRRELRLVGPVPSPGVPSSLRHRVHGDVQFGKQTKSDGRSAPIPAATDRHCMVFKSDGGDEAAFSYRRLPSLPYRGFPNPQTVRQSGASDPRTGPPIGKPAVLPHKMPARWRSLPALLHATVRPPRPSRHTTHRTNHSPSPGGEGRGEGGCMH
jgi:hypothetical protein